MYGIVSVCERERVRVCVRSSAPSSNPVKHLDNGVTAGLVFLHSAAWRGEDDVLSIQMYR